MSDPPERRPQALADRRALATPSKLNTPSPLSQSSPGMDGLIRDLSVISKLPVHGKLSSDRNGLYIEPTYQIPLVPVTPILRWYRADSRQQTMLDLHKLVNKIQEKTQDVGLVPAEILEVIPKACKGLENLQATYSRDPQCSSEIEMLIKKLSGFSSLNNPVK